MVSLFRKTYEDEGQDEFIRSGFEPSEGPAAGVSDFAVGEDEEDVEHDHASTHDESDEARRWKQRDGAEDLPAKGSPTYGSLDEERHVWGTGGGHKHEAR